MKRITHCDPNFNQRMKTDESDCWLLPKNGTNVLVLIVDLEKLINKNHSVSIFIKQYSWNFSLLFSISLLIFKNYDKTVFITNSKKSQIWCILGLQTG